MLNECAAYANAARIVRNKQVLQIAVIVRRPGRSMINRMRQAQCAVSRYRKHRMHWLDGVQQARPRLARHGIREINIAAPLIGFP